MGSGKTAVGRQLAAKSGLEFLDSDQEIQRRTGVDIPYIFEKEGEAGFREREKEVIAELTQRAGILLATGGGVVLDAENRLKLKATGIVIYLYTTVEEQLRRTGRSKTRPLLLNDNPKATLLALRKQRQPLYDEIADYRVDTTGRRVKNVAASIFRMLDKEGRLALQN